MALRIIGGLARGRRLGSLPGKLTRPTGDRVREALFNILGQRLDGWRFLDVCAGSGAVALEALSRGAYDVVAVEEDTALCRHIREEAARLDLAEGLEVRRGDARAELLTLRRQGKPSYHAAFVDPPWKKETLRQEILGILLEEPPLCDLAVVEFPSDASEPAAPAGARMTRRADYGGTALAFYEPGKMPPQRKNPV